MMFYAWVYDGLKEVTLKIDWEQEGKRLGALPYKH